MKKSLIIKLGIILMVVSVPFFLFLPLIPFLEMEGKDKITLSTVVFVIAEILFWSGGLLVGKELFAKYKSYFNPKNWFGNKEGKAEKEKEEESAVE